MDFTKGSARGLSVCVCVFRSVSELEKPLTPWRQLYVSMILTKVVKTCFLKQVWGREERYFLVLLLKYVSYETGMLRGGLPNEVSQNHQVATCSRSPHPKLQLVQAIAMMDFFFDQWWKLVLVFHLLSGCVTASCENFKRASNPLYHNLGSKTKYKATEKVMAWSVTCLSLYIFFHNIAL